MVLQGMLQALKHRGEDSTGYALYGDTDGKNFIMRFKVGENVGEGSSSIMEDVSVYDERKKMVKEAESNKEADKKKRESVDSRNQADTLLHSTEKNLKEHGSKVSDADKKAIETASANLRNSLKGTDVEDIKKQRRKV